jgi:hypothetical protein
LKCRRVGSNLQILSAREFKFIRAPEIRRQLLSAATAAVAMSKASSTEKSAHRSEFVGGASGMTWHMF